MNRIRVLRITIGFGLLLVTACGGKVPSTKHATPTPVLVVGFVVDNSWPKSAFEPNLMQELETRLTELNWEPRIVDYAVLEAPFRAKRKISERIQYAKGLMGENEKYLLFMEMLLSEEQPSPDDDITVASKTRIILSQKDSGGVREKLYSKRLYVESHQNAKVDAQRQLIGRLADQLSFLTDQEIKANAVPAPAPSAESTPAAPAQG